MKTFYSILYCTIRPNLDEKVSIGLFMGNSDEWRFQYSLEKLHVIKDLFSDAAFNTIKFSLKSLSSLSLECASDAMGAFKGHKVLSGDYFDYLSRYSQNLITYSKPVEIDVEVDNTIFDTLFEKFIFNLPKNILHKTRPMEQVKRILSKSIADHVNFDVELSGADIPGLIVPAKLWFIGKNDVQVTGETKDFNGLPHIIQQQVNAHLYLIEKIRDTAAGKNGHFFFIADEPGKNLPENHKLWKAVTESKLLDVVPTGEIGKVEEYMKVHGVAPLFTQEPV